MKDIKIIYTFNITLTMSPGVMPSLLVKISTHFDYMGCINKTSYLLIEIYGNFI